MIDLDKDIELYKSKVAFYESHNTRGEYYVTARELKYVVEILETLRSEIKTMGDCISRSDLKKAIMHKTGIVGETWEQLYDSVINDIDNAPPVCGNNPKWCEHCVSKDKCASTRTKDECETCGYRLFANKLTDNLVEVMVKHGITSVEELVQKLKGGNKE